MSEHNPPRVAIVGGGIAGLAACWELARLKPDCEITLFEANSHFGGALRTESSNGFLIEHSADMFLGEPDAAVRLCQDVGLGDELIQPNAKQRFSYVVHRGKLERIPTGFALMSPNRILPVLQSPILSWHGKLRFLMEWFAKRPSQNSDESLRSFAVRHFGREVFERLIQPLVAGIYSAKAEELSIQATLDRFVKMESEHGSLIRAARAAKSNVESAGARYGLFFAPKRGLQSLVDALLGRLQTNKNVRLVDSTAVEELNRGGESWTLTVRGQEEPFDGVVLATKASVSSTLLADASQAVSSQLDTLRFGSLVVVAIATSHDNFSTGPPVGFGFVVPKIEQRDIIAGSFSSNKFPGRAPERKLLLRCFFGGDQVERWCESSNEDLIAVANRELEQLIGFRADPTSDQYRVFRWRDCMPQYQVGHLDKIASLDRAVSELKCLALAGSSYTGVGIPACIESGASAASRIAAQI